VLVVGIQRKSEYAGPMLGYVLNNRYYEGEVGLFPLDKLGKWSFGGSNQGYRSIQLFS
jgi:hypothetical protein